MNHLAPEDVERFADGEITDSAIEQHLLECARCSMAVLQVVQMKRAIHEAIRDEAPSPALRRRVSARESLPAWWVAVAAIIVLVLITGLLTRTRTPSALPELVDKMNALQGDSARSAGRATPPRGRGSLRSCGRWSPRSASRLGPRPGSGRPALPGEGSR